MKLRNHLSLIMAVMTSATCDLTAQQNFSNVWYFGVYAGIDFNSGSPVALAAGPMNAGEGSASICDNNGSLLFYTSGSSVWNKNHAVMPNGSGLLGDPGCNQSALVVPVPGSSTLYYIFTMTENPTDGLSYSIVDLALDGGKGDVSTKNTTLSSLSVTQKLTGIKHSNGTDYWVLIHEWNSDKFHAFQVASTGINSTAVVSAVGAVHTGGWNTVGYMKANPQGTKLAVARRDASMFEIFDFNSSTGAVSNPVTLTSLDSYAYGLEFSPDGSKLYTSYMTSNTMGAGKIFQYDLLAGSASAIIASAYSLSVTSAVRALQLGPDGKIYIANSSQDLAVINSPNASGSACGYTENGFALANGTSSNLGMPNFVNSFLSAGGTVGITTEFTRASIRSYPNPATSYCTIEIPNNGIRESVNVTITDLAGRKTKTAWHLTTTDILSIRLNTEELEAGIYLVSIFDGKAALSREKIIVIR